MSIYVHAQIISTVAGNGINGVSGDGGYAIDAECNTGAMGFDTSGNIYMADAFHDVVRKISTTGIIYTIAGNGTEGYSGDGGQATAAGMYWPIDAAVDRSGNIFITEAISNRVRKIAPDGIISTVAGGGHSRDFTQSAIATNVSLWAPAGIATDNNGNVFFSEKFNHCISKLSTTGIITTIAGTGAGGYNGDNIMASGAKLNDPQGITIDQAGNIYVADAGNDRIRKINISGIITTVAGSGTYGYSGDNIAATDAQVKSASDVAVDKAGNLYIADRYNQRIRKVDKAGIITTIAGTGIAGFSGDGGIATDAQLNGPGGIGVNDWGYVYIADGNNYRLRYIHSTLAAQNVNKSTGELTAHPNPNNGEFIVNIPSGITEQVKITMMNMLGELVKELISTTNRDIQINENLPSGVYLISAVTAAGKHSTRISVISK